MSDQIWDDAVRFSTEWEREEYAREKAAKLQNDETAKLRAALESIAGWRNVNIQGEYEHGLRDIIRSITDCATAALEASAHLSQAAESIAGVYCGLDAEQTHAVDLKWGNSHD